MDDFKGKAINPFLEIGSDWERFRVELTPEFEALRVKAIELLQPFAEKELNDVSNGLTYFTVDGDDNSYDVCDKDECVAEMLENLKKDNPHSEIESILSDDGGDHEGLNTCSVCGRHLNTQLTWFADEFEYIKGEEWNKEFFTEEAFTIYCILEAIPSNDHEIDSWAKKEYKNGNTLYVDLRTEFYEKLMELSYSIVTLLENGKNCVND